MLAVKPYLVLICVALLLAPATFAADPPANAPQTAGQNPADHHSPFSDTRGWLGQAIGPYRVKQVPPPDLTNSGRLESLMRAGNIYLSLQDCIALALENNLDIEIQRYGPALADAALQLASAGGFARGVSTSVTAGPSSASVSSSGTTSGSNQNATSQASAGTASAVGGSVIQSSGPSIPNLDPTLTGGASWAHITAPQSSAFTTGTNFLITRQDMNNLGVQKGFLTGTTVSLGLSNSTVTNNSMRADFNPATSGALSLSFTQHLLQGFGWSVNSRQIRIARNNREVSDLTFKLQVVTTVTAVMELYWDLVAFNESVRVAQDALTASQKLLDDNKRQVEVGTLAPIEIVRAEAQIATGEQDLLVAQTRVLQQETIIKTALSRTGVASPTVAGAHIIPIDHIQMPGVEPTAPIQDLNALALTSRPELAQSRIQLLNQELTMKGSKNGLLPTLDVVASLANNALAGQVNTLPAPAGTVHSNTPFFIGGYGTVLSQLFARNFPNYSAGFNLSVPLRNRAAQAQVITDELTYRQQQLGLQRLENQVRVDVQNALIGLMQARAQYQAAVKGVLLQQQSLDAEQKKLALGASTIYNVILMQRDLVTAQSNQVTAEAAYVKARVELDRSTGQILNNNNISLDEAFKGVVSRPPSPIPAVPPPGATQAPAPRQ
jgi:outer membrane protein TolC